jgi:hypothetical protein
MFDGMRLIFSEKENKIWYCLTSSFLLFSKAIREKKQS